MTIPVTRVLAALLAEPDGDHYGLALMQASGLASGTLYPILARLTEAGWLEKRWEEIDPVAQSWNLYCVVHRASLDVTHKFEHRSAAMQEVRWVVDDRTRGIELQHRLMDYNNLPTTTFADIKAVLAEAITRLEAKVDRHGEH